MANPIQRVVKLVLDKAAARRMEADAKKSLKGVEGGLGSLKKAAVQMGAAIAAALSIRATFNFFKESIRIGGEAEAIWNRLGQAVENAGVRYEAVKGRIQNVAVAMQDATRIGDEEFADGLRELITTSGDYEESLKNMALVADLAAAKQISFVTSAQLVGKVMAGQTSLLSRYGIVVKEGDDAIEVMRKRFAGFAANEAVTFEGKLIQVNNAWGDFREAIGEALIAGASGETMLDKLTAAIKRLTDSVNIFGRAYAGMSETAFQNSSAINNVVASAKTPEQALRGLATYQQITARELEDAQKRLDGMTGTWATIKGTLKKGDFFSWQTEVDSAKETVDGLATTMAELDRVMEDIRSGKQTVGILKPTTTPTGTGTGTGGRRVPIEDLGELTGGLLQPRMPMVMRPKDIEGMPQLSKFTQQTEALASAQESARTMAQLLGEDYNTLNDQMGMLASTMQALSDMGIGPQDERMQGLAERMRELQYESDLVIRQQELMATVALATGDVLNAVFGAGVGPMAAGKAKQNAIMAAEQLAMGLVASLNPLTAVKAAGHYTASAKFAGIASAWAALAGATGGFGGGAGSAGGFSSGRGVGGQESGRLTSVGPELNVYFTGEGFDAVNPRVQRVIYTGMKEAEKSIGGNARVRTFRGSIPQQQGGG